MSSSKPILLIVFISLLLGSSSAQSAVKATYWFAGSEFPLTDIDSSLFTHLFCAFADLNTQTNQLTISSANQQRFSTFTETVQRRNPNVKTLLSIGGGGFPPPADALASMASNPDSRKSFIDSSISLARSNNFHGLDLDWEYPETTTEMNNFGALIREWRSAVEAEASSSGRERLLLAAAVFYSNDHYSALYPIQDVVSSFDWINLMSYDFYYAAPDGSRVTGPPAALYDPSNAGISGDAGVKSWIQAGLPANKAVFGFPYFGNAWQLSDANRNSYYAPTTGAVLYDGNTIRYDQIKKFIADNGATKVHNTSVVGDYAYSGTTWIGYDDIQTIEAKVKYAKQNGLLGYFSWQIGQDDNSALSRAASQAWDAQATARSGST